jgi:hypothetical protein
LGGGRLVDVTQHHKTSHNIAQYRIISHENTRNHTKSHKITSKHTKTHEIMQLHNITKHHQPTSQNQIRQNQAKSDKVTTSLLLRGGRPRILRRSTKNHVIFCNIL